MAGKKTNSAASSAIDAATNGAPIAMTLDDAVKFSGVGRSSLYCAIREGALIARKAGSRTIIMRDDLQAFVAALPVAKIVGSRAKGGKAA
jgi:hypothetical protein